MLTLVTLVLPNYGSNNGCGFVSNRKVSNILKICFESRIK